MYPINYIIFSNQIGSGNVAKVYKIREINSPHTILIAKIFDESKIKQYEEEKKILLKLSEQNNNEGYENDYFIKLKNIEVRLEYSNVYLNNSKLLIFDYLIHDRLCDYLYKKSNNYHIKEIHIKLLCYKLLLGLKKCHQKNICHNTIDLKNIMFDKDFNPVLIHFSEATMDIQNDDFNKDFKGLGILLAKIITSGVFKTILLDKKRNKYFIKINDAKVYNFQKKIMEESVFWKRIETKNPIKISNEFKNFFEILVKSKNILNVDDLLNNDWLKEIKDNLNEIDKDFKKDFKSIYSNIEDSQKMGKFNIDDISLVLNPLKKETSIFNEIKHEDGFHKFNSSENNELEIKDFGEKTIIVVSRNENDAPKKRRFKARPPYINSLLKKIKSDRGEIKNKINLFKDLEKKKGEENLTLENIDIQTIQYEPKGIQFNYIEINIKGTDYSCKRTLNKYIKKLQTNIKKFNYEKFINIEMKNLTNNCGFDLTFKELENDKEDNDEELVYLNEDDDADKDLMALTMKVELFKLEQPKYAENNKYYLMFNYVQGDMDDYYEYLKIIKTLSTS